ncbi:lysine transporter LysE [Streptomyces sp. NPDC056160]|uniref:lysine transporter LysE n=1 Tax=Streptomyces sp. NPDC056160 TaxID=3345731 RepID=UPI0035D5B68D
MGVRSTAKHVGDLLIELVGETIGEAILSLLACALLAFLVLIAYLSWSFSPRLTVAGAALVSLLLAHGAWQTFRSPGRGRRRGLAAVTAAVFTLTTATAALLLLYATDCHCL